MAKGEITAQEGSFPLTRGKRGLVQILSSPRAHPRSRRENDAPDSIPGGPQGSSPLTRGKRRRFREWPGRTRLIPAHAGKTRQCPPWFPDRTAHPRSRGENEYVPTNGDVLEGSSPLTRGKHPISIHMLLGARLIPAHAGKTFSVPFGCRWEPAHPRSRGENYRMGTATRYVEGSSPLTRGKPMEGVYAVGCERLIPAHAGKTSGRLLRAVLGRAHPRSRGENARANGPACPRRGSSPLTRGKLGGDKLVGVLSRLIPAHAGKTPPT